MTKIIVQHFVENLLKVLKPLKTRTALIMNGLAAFRLRYTRQGAKAPFKTKEQNRLLIKKLDFFFKNMIEYNHRKVAMYLTEKE